jgi:hypothetical protein
VADRLAVVADRVPVNDPWKVKVPEFPEASSVNRRVKLTGRLEKGSGVPLDAELKACRRVASRRAGPTSWPLGASFMAMAPKLPGSDGMTELLRTHE